MLVGKDIVLRSLTLDDLDFLFSIENNTSYFIHRYSIFNFQHWKKYNFPKGNIKKHDNSKKNMNWKKYLESKKQSDYIFFKSFK